MHSMRPTEEEITRMAPRRYITNDPNTMELMGPMDEEIERISRYEFRNLKAESRLYLRSSHKLLGHMKEGRKELSMELKNRGYEASEWFSVFQEALEGVENKLITGVETTFEDLVDRQHR
ncbi:MAG: hypothetical protein Q9228_007867 [Teloschistes exilis]